MEEMANLISNFGFPIVLVIYLFTRFERLFAEVIDSIEQRDRQAIYDYFAAAKQRRDCILDKTEKMFEI